VKYLGIDPGLSGAVAVMEGAVVTVWDLPSFKTAKGRELDLTAIARDLDAYGPFAHAALERVSTRPNEGRAQAFRFGAAAGALQGIVAANFIPVSLPTPTQWKRALGVPAAKDGARQRATQLLPGAAWQWSRAKDHDRAEAALLALYAARTDVARTRDGEDMAAVAAE